MKRIPLIASLILFILLCASGSYWAMRLIKPEVRKFSVPQTTKPVADVESVASLFGGAMLVDTSYQLKGIVQANPMSQSVAIIGIDGKPMQAYPMNQDVNPGSALSGVFSDYVLLQDNGVSKRVELPQEQTLSGSITPVENSKPSASQTNAVSDRMSSNSRDNEENKRKKPMGAEQGMKIPPPPPPIKPTH